MTYGSVDEDHKDDPDSEYNVLDPALLDLDMPVQANVNSSIGCAFEDISISHKASNIFQQLI